LLNDGGVALREHVFLFLFIIYFTLLPFAEADDILKIESSVTPKSLTRGQEGKVILKLTLQEGLTISPQPSFSIEFSPCEGIVFSKKTFTDSDLEIEILEEMGEEYLNLKSPLEILFTVSPDAAKGEHLLEGKIVYFACSKEEGWCMKNSSKFTVTFSTQTTSLLDESPSL
jgi:hypothetical protein